MNSLTNAEFKPYPIIVVNDHSYSKDGITETDINIVEKQTGPSSVQKTLLVPCDEYKDKEYTYWPRHLTLKLLEEYKTHYKLVGKTIRSLKKLFQIIADVLNKCFNVKLSGIQVSNKFKTLERTYKIVIDNNNKTGRARKFFEFESELDQIFAKSKKIRPEILLSSDTEDPPQKPNHILEDFNRNSIATTAASLLELTVDEVPTSLPTSSVTNIIAEAKAVKMNNSKEVTTQSILLPLKV